MYKKIINFLVKYYTGTVSWKLGKWYMSGVKPFLLTYIIIWGLLKVVQFQIYEITFFAWWDFIIILLLIPQVIASFSLLAINEQKRLNSENEENK